MSILAAIVFAVSFLTRFLNPQFHNDHFVFMTLARQVLHGDVPVRDFAERGHPLTVGASALAQVLLGHSLAGEALLSMALLSLGASLTFVLGRRVSGSTLLGMIAAATTIALYPRLYSYPKVLMYVGALVVLWKYVDERSIRWLFGIALCTAVAFLFRHDHGAYVGAAAVVMLTAVHWRDSWAMLLRHLALYAGIVSVLLLPFGVFLWLNGGIVGYFDRALSYVRAESVDSRPRFIVRRSDASSSLGSSLPRPQRGAARATGFGWQDTRNRLSAPFRSANAVLWLYHLFTDLPFVAIGWLAVKRRWLRPACERVPGEAPKILSAATLCLAADQLLLCSNLEARLSDVAAPTAVLAAWLLAEGLGRRPGAAHPPAAPRSVARGGRLGLARHWASLVLWTCRVGILGGLVGLTAASVWVVGEARSQIRATELLMGPRAVLRRGGEVFRWLRTSPPDESWPPLGSDWPSELVRYVRACTKANDRLLVTWFAPELYYYSGRAFAGGHDYFQARHWSSREEQERAISKLRAQAVPIVLVDVVRYDVFRRHYGMIHAYLMAHYRVVAESTFGGPKVFRVLADQGRTPSGTYGAASLPCFM